MNVKKLIAVAAVAASAALPLHAETISVPVEYEVVSYIESTGKQSIDTGILPGTSLSLYMDFMLTGYADSDADVLFGTKWDWYAWNMRLYYNQFQWFGDNVDLGAIVQNTRLLLDIKTDGTIRFRNHGDGSTRYSKTGQTLSGERIAGVPLCLFGYTDAQGGGRRCTARLFRCCMATNGIPARDFIPVKRVSDSKAGLYDMVSEAFFTDESSAGVALNVGNPVPADAWWTGAVNADIASPANWTCKDANGDVMSGAVPGDFTTVHFGGSFAVQSPRGSALPCARIVFADNASLAADCDWRGLSERTDFEGRFHLGGHELRVSNLAGTGVIGPHTGYERLEYIQSSNAQCIRTGIVPGENTALDLDFMMTAYTSAAVLFGTGTWGNDCWNFRTYVRNNNNSFEWFGAGTGTGLGNFIQDKRLHIEIKTDKTVTISDHATGGAVYGPFTNQSLKNNNNAELTLFGFQNGDRRCSMRVYGCKIWQNGSLVRNFTPARRLSDGAVGLYDEENSAFHENIFETPLASGPALSTDDAAGGTVRVEVPAKTTASNSSLAIRGATRLVKEGAGTFESATAKTSYLGGTFISNGLVRASAAHSLGGVSDVHVAPDGVVDMKGNDMNEYTFVLDGGTVSNTVGRGATAIQLKKMRLTADSQYHTTGSYGFSAPDLAPTSLDLGGHTLSAYIGNGQYFTLINTTVTNGTIRMMTGGYIRPFTTGSHAVSVDMSTVNLKMLNCAICMDADMSVHDYESRYTENYNLSWTSPIGTLAVHGRFTPATRYYCGCTLQDGATLDLSEWPAGLGWPMYSRFTTGADKTLKFADGANVTVNLAGREDVKALAKNRTYLLKWGDTTGTLAKKPVNVTFTLDAQSRANGYRIYSEPEGLRLKRFTGFMILVK